MLPQQFVTPSAADYWELAAPYSPKIKSPSIMTSVDTATHGCLHSDPAFLHKASKTCANRKSTTQNSLLKELADGNSEEEFLEKEKQ